MININTDFNTSNIWSIPIPITIRYDQYQYQDLYIYSYQYIFGQSDLKKMSQRHFVLFFSSSKIKFQRWSVSLIFVPGTIKIANFAHFLQMSKSANYVLFLKCVIASSQPLFSKNSFLPFKGGTVWREEVEMLE